MDAVLDLFRDMRIYMSDGGAVMYLLVILTIVLWYGIAYRTTELTRGSKKNIRKLLKKSLSGKAENGQGYIVRAVNKAVSVRNNHKGDIYRYLDEALFQITEKMGNYRTIVRVVVIIAPLAGLLGTVSGMIEMFDSLGSQTFNSQTGGIAGGISQALFTTQFGLVVAIPGMIIGRALDKREDSMKDEINQIKEYLNGNCYKGDFSEIPS